MDAPPTVLVWTVGTGALVAATIQTARIWWSGFAIKRELRTRARHAAAGERRAEHLLERRGYEILGRQVTTRWHVDVGERSVAIDLRADLLVSRSGRCFVAEVKTGIQAPRIETTATRRQLLEYRAAFGADGVLLVAPDTETIYEVRFRLPREETGMIASVGQTLACLLLGLLAGLALATWYRIPQTHDVHGRHTTMP